jgi:hypothetical protein
MMALLQIKRKLYGTEVLDLEVSYNPGRIRYLYKNVGIR